MKLINYELRNKLWDDVYNKVLEHAPWDSPVHKQIEKNFGWRLDHDNLIMSKIYNPNINIMDDIDETD